jgi:hypothetical protein
MRTTALLIALLATIAPACVAAIRFESTGLH